MKIKRLGQWDYVMVIIWLIIGLPILIWCIIGTYSDLKRDLIETTWTVSHIWVYYRSENSDIIKYSISATYDCWSKKWVEWNSMDSTGQYYEIGDKITLYCDENEPLIFYFNKDLLYTRLLLWLIFWMPWLIISLIGIIKVKRQKERKKIDQELKQFGTKLEATIVDINQTEYQGGSGLISKIIGQSFWLRNTSKNARFDWKLWFQVTVQYWEDVFISENIYADIYYALDIWDKIDVYLDKNDYSKFFIDIDSILEKNYKVLKPTTNKKWGYLIVCWATALIMSILLVNEKWFDLLTSLLCFTIAIFLLYFWIKRVIQQKQRKKQAQELKQFGTKVEATVLLVLEMIETANKQIKNNRRILDNNYRIIAKYNKETFLSNKYSGDIDKLIKKWDKIDIYLDNSDHSKYYVDVDSLVEKNPVSKNLFRVKCID